MSYIASLNVNGDAYREYYASESIKDIKEKVLDMCIQYYFSSKDIEFLDVNNFENYTCHDFIDLKSPGEYLLYEKGNKDSCLALNIYESTEFKHM